MANSADPGDRAQAARKARLALLARAPATRVMALWSAYLGTGSEPAHKVLRAPEIGTVMVRGRTGAVGAAFNLGEMTVTRCSVRLSDGTVGHGYVQGGEREAARLVALIDAACQAGQGAELDRAILAPLRAEAEDRQQARAGRAAATRVEFFTMVRGEG